MAEEKDVVGMALGWKQREENAQRDRIQKEDREMTDYANEKNAAEYDKLRKELGLATSTPAGKDVADNAKDPQKMNGVLSFLKRCGQRALKSFYSRLTHGKEQLTPKQPDKIATINYFTIKNDSSRK